MADRLLEEYKALREELKVNRQFIFERPLLIVGVSFVAMINLGSRLELAGVAVAFFVFLFYYNLWFTTNRLRSNARIVGYIQVVLEGEFKTNWIGWERALAFYRNWCLDPSWFPRRFIPCLGGEPGDVHSEVAKKFQKQIGDRARLVLNVVEKRVTSLTK